MIYGVSWALSPWGYNLFVIPKLYLFVNLTVLFFAVAIFYFFLGGLSCAPSRPVVALSVAFLVLLALSTANSVLPHISFFGKMPRYEGFLAWLLYFVLFFGGYVFIDNTAARKNLFWVISTATIAVCAYGILQSLGLDPLKTDPVFSISRIRSTLGNASTLGAYLALSLPFIAAARLKAPAPKAKIVISASLLLGLAALALTQSRGAWLGVFIAFLFILYKSASIARLQRTVRWISVGAAVLTVLVGVVYVSSRLELERGTASGRIILWKQTSQAVASRPLLGWGPETLQFIFPRYISKEYEQRVTRKTTIDNAHNIFLHNAFGSGLPSSAILLALFLIILRSLNRAGNSMSEPGAFALGTAAGLIGYLIALQFHFSTIAVSPTFWILLGAGLRAADMKTGQEETSVARPRYVLVPLLIGACLSWVLILPGAAKVVIADAQLRKGLVEAGRGHATTAYLSLIQAEQNHPADEYYPLTTGQVFLRIAANRRSPRLLGEAVKAFDRARALNPVDEQAQLGLADAAMIDRQIGGDGKDLRRAISWYDRILSNDPNFSEVKAKRRKAAKLLGSEPGESRK